MQRAALPAGHTTSNPEMMQVTMGVQRTREKRRQNTYPATIYPLY